MVSILLGVILVLVLSVQTYAQDVAPGDTVRLVERDLHIPAHPAPGDTRVHVRLTSGTQATVLSIDAHTGWIEVRGEAVSGEPRTGWITATYVAGRDPGSPPSPGPLQWCPAKGAASPHPHGRLRIATWNFGNLHAQDGQSIFLGPDPSVRRTAIDYERIRCYVRLFDPDVLAVQEVDGPEALKRVVDTDVYNVHVSGRPRGTLNGKQNTGFVYKKGLHVTPQADVDALDLGGTGRLRYGARVDLMHNGHTLQFIAVHLKSGCFQNDSTSSACETLQQQIPALEHWIDEAARGPHPFVVLGDFNRRLTLPGDTVRAEIDDGQPENADLTVMTDHMPISCRDNRFTEFIDHIVLDKRVAQWVEAASFRQVTYRQADQPVWDQISDHCPVVVDVWLP